MLYVVYILYICSMPASQKGLYRENVQHAKCTQFSVGVDESSELVNNLRYLLV